MTWENRNTFEVLSPTGWIDFTQRIRDVQQVVEIGIGRQNDLDNAEPSTLTLLLDNRDDALTFGNPNSPYASWWGPIRKCRIRETIGGYIQDLMTGWLQVPEETIVTEAIEQTVSVNVVDWLGRLAASQPFLSTLATYVQYSYPSTLQRYWTLGSNQVQSFLSFPDIVGGTGIVITRNAADPASSFVLADGPVALADDLTCPLFTPGPLTSYYLLSTNLAVNLAAGQVMTILGWFLPNSTTNTGTAEFMNASIVETGPSGTSALHIFCSPTLTAQLVFGALSGTINSGVTVPIGVGLPIAIRYGYSPSVFELWIGSQRFTGSLSGSPPATSTVLQLTVGTSYGGRIGHLQVHVGLAGSFDFAAFAAQQQVGLLGFERQLTGDRIRAIAQYAGIPNADFANTIDSGTSVMQAASLAGKTPLDAMREAETTEQGLLYVDGSGNLTFKDRRSLYNI